MRDDRQVSDHLCECGCGEYTLIVPQPDARWGHVKGEPLRYVYGHGPGRQKVEVVDPRTSADGLCLCGCGQRTPVSTRNIHRLGHVKGEHVPYLQGHGTGRRATTGILYFVGTEDGPIKVGWTIGLTRRLREMQVAHWLELVVYGSITANGALEREAHAALKAHRIRGEWFEREAALRLLGELRDP